jgi:DNA polymerase-3 subunit epsilon
MLGYAVIDTETTGLNIRKNDRIVEVAVVLLDMDLNITGTYETVLNPARDLGLVSLHGIDGLIASEGVLFRDIMPSLSGLLHNRIIVGHNVQFDIGMLEDEYQKESVDPYFGVFLDTLQVAKSLPFRCSNYRLGTLCEHFGIPLEDAHTAMADAMATAKLLITMAQRYDLKVTCLPADLTATSMAYDFNEWTPRDKIKDIISQPADLKKYIFGLSNGTKDLPENSINTYLRTIHLALINDEYSLREKSRLEQTINDLSLTRTQAVDLNEEYIFMLICKNLHENNKQWIHGVNTERIQMVQEFTGVEDDRVTWLVQETLANDHLIQPTVEKLNTYFSFVSGDIFVVTGEDLDYSKEHWNELLGGLGFVPKSDTTKNVKLVIAADPYSLSAKAAKARKYGIPVITEKTLMRILDIQN